MECPVCKQRMQVKTIEDVKVDVCESHGIWLDKGEVEALMEVAKKRGEHEGLIKNLSYTMDVY
ncbi:MAG: zf-TFIIB domain-containing protein [Candidatus Aenigmarchaeota archaeon]|nr:zf-TFIIB domain-containing protein [Candidatus Aenigmarchaeota archaeon]